jgi:hypothetical protein
MFNFIRAKLQRWGSKEAREAAQYFVDMLKGADLEGRALTVALAADFRNKVVDTDEFVDARIKGLAPALLVQTYRDLQKADLFPNAAGVAVWIHTERALNDLTVVPVAKEMWALLRASYPYVESAADGFRMISGHQLELRDFDVIPTGFE